MSYIIDPRDFKLLFPGLLKTIEKSYGSIEKIQINSNSTYAFYSQEGSVVRDLKGARKRVPSKHKETFEQDYQRFLHLLDPYNYDSSIEDEIHALCRLRNKNAQALIKAVKARYGSEIFEISVNKWDNLLSIRTRERSWKIRLLFPLGREGASCLADLNPGNFLVGIQKKELPSVLFETYSDDELRLIKKVTKRPFRNFTVKSDIIFCRACNENTFCVNVNELGPTCVLRFEKGVFLFDQEESARVNPIWIPGLSDAIHQIAANRASRRLKILGEPLKEAVFVNLELPFLTDEDKIEIPALLTDDSIIWAELVTDAVECLRNLNHEREEEEKRRKEQALTRVKESYLSQAVLSVFRKDEWLEKEAAVSFLRDDEVDGRSVLRSPQFKGAFSILRKSELNDELDQLAKDGFIEEKSYLNGYGKVGYNCRLSSRSVSCRPEELDCPEGQAARECEDFIQKEHHDLNDFLPLLTLLQENPMVWCVRKKRLLPAILEVEGPVSELIAMRKSLASRGSLEHRMLVDLEKALKNNR